jgi:hypothetical protein
LAASIVVGAGILHLGRSFREGPAPDRGLAGSGPTHRLVTAALYKAAGLSLGFSNLANIVADRAAMAP